MYVPVDYYENAKAWLFRVQLKTPARYIASFGAGVHGIRDAWAVPHPGRPARAHRQHPRSRFRRPSGMLRFFFLTEGLAGRLWAHDVDAATEAPDHQPVWVELA